MMMRIDDVPQPKMLLFQKQGDFIDGAAVDGRGGFPTVNQVSEIVRRIAKLSDIKHSPEGPFMEKGYPNPIAQRAGKGKMEGEKDSDKIFLVIFGEFIYKSQKLLE